MKKLAFLLILATAAAAQPSYPTAVKSKEPRRPAVKRTPAPSEVLPVGTEYVDKQGQTQQVTGYGRSRNVTNYARDPQTGQTINSPVRMSQPSQRGYQRVNAVGKPGNGYPNGQQSINPSESSGGYPGQP